ncbi:ABC transporter ATP-binding protein [Rothia terrae]
MLVALALVSIVGQVFLDLKVPDYMQRITMRVATPGTVASDLTGDGALMLSAALGSLVLAVITGFCTAIVGTSLAKNLRQKVFSKTFELSSAQVNNIGTDSLITRSTNDVMQIQMFVVMGFQMLIKSPIMAIWASSKIATQSMAWTVPTAIAVVATIITLAVVIALVMPRMVRMQKITDGLNRVTREHISGLRVIRAYTSQSFHRNRFEDVNADLRNTTLFVNTGFAFLMPMLTVIMNALSLAIYGVGAHLINDAGSPGDKVTLFGQMVAFSSYALQVVSAFMMLAAVFIFAPRAWVSYTRVREVLGTEPDIADADASQVPASSSVLPTGSATAPSSATQTPAIEFDNVSFRYPGADNDALHGISFTVHRGETLAIIGSTGSGKSSLISLIPRFSDVRKGSVKINGTDVRHMTQSELRNGIAYVPQKSTLFSGTVASTIAFSHAEHDNAPQLVVSASKTAEAAEFIERADKAYAAPVASGGSNFSGGQKQRLSIARAVAYQAPLMIFDDSFSALDYKTDSLVRSHLHDAGADTTLVIVAQRIGTVKNADKILVLDKGRAVGFGTHRELLASNPVYQEIARSQLSEEELA